MEKLMVLDGDFEAQLRRNLGQKENLDSAFALQALRDNQYAVYKTHLDYLRAGAQIIRTNTYRASLDSIKKHLHVPESPPMLHIAVQLAKQALFKYHEETGPVKNRSRPLVAGCLSSYASTFEDETNGFKHTTNSVFKFLSWYHRQRVQQLLKFGVDILAFESIPCMREVKAIIEVLKLYLNARIWITFSCQPNGLLLDGTSFEKAATYCCNTLPTQIYAIGAKCSLPNSMKFLMREINDKRYLKIPFVFYVDKCHFSTTEANGASIIAPQNNFMKELFDCGVRYIGGGTNTVAEDIREIRKQVDNYCPSKKKITLLNSYSNQNTLNHSKL
ncbi:homocysteine S-methyltransferase YbgG-like [Odontomachus brunneus]|uniref:homocysteine S-methyltransferase YbgG-like n=1 Tax=Odontomachus brunneus TaxID=486640 RepID=UPI0013F22CFF|nr:homocysteine S-methyltransferase YbgG-like [Odontomachus brunneus]